MTLFKQYIDHRFVKKPKLFKKETQLNDKILVRKNIKQHNITDKVPDIYYVGDILNCDMSKLPKNYVIKPRCMCNGKGILFVQNNYNITTKKIIDVNQIRHYYTNFKSNRGMGNHVIIEEFLLDKNNIPIKDDYKFFVFDGEVKNITYIKNMNNKDHKKYDHDKDWNRVKIHVNGSADINEKVDKPNNLDEMIELAEKMGKFYHEFIGIPFVRVDIYDTNKGVIFGEYTGGPNGGRKITQEYQKKFGEYWTNILKKKSQNNIYKLKDESCKLDGK